MPKRLTQNFTQDEFLCPCCGDCGIEIDFVMELQAIRTRVGFPLAVNSGWRCEEHNEKISPKSKGDHVRGYAVDVQCSSRYKRAEILQHALNSGFFKDIAIGKSFIHLGRGKSKQGIGVYA